MFWLVIILNAKYNTKMDLTDIAKQMGRLGGKARARRLSRQAKQAIGSLGGKARAQSLLVAKRIEQNFAYVAALSELQGKPCKVKQIKHCTGRLPGIYPDGR